VLTTCNLSDHLSEGDLIRIKHRLFKIVAVRKAAIELDRRWLHGVITLLRTLDALNFKL
jgi:hypothetical protein